LRSCRRRQAELSSAVRIAFVNFGNGSGVGVAAFVCQDRGEVVPGFAARRADALLNEVALPVLLGVVAVNVAVLGLFCQRLDLLFGHVWIVVAIKKFIFGLCN